MTSGSVQSSIFRKHRREISIATFLNVRSDLELYGDVIEICNRRFIGSLKFYSVFKQIPLEFRRFLFTHIFDYWN